MHARLTVIGLVLSLARFVSAQQDCPLPPVLRAIPHEQNIFTDEQESDLGDILSDALVRDELVVNDDALNGHLRDVAARVILHLPHNSFRFHFSLIELPVANAFALPGGRIYVSRKLVSEVKNDDELAGILAHELGHVMTHQGAILMTSIFHQVLGVDSVTSRADIGDKIHRVLENWAKKNARIKLASEDKQEAADQVSLYAISRAGFRPQSFADILDRLQQTNGRTGNWVTDLFRTTKLEQKRLRELLRQISAMPATCIATLQPNSDAGFRDWQAQVIAYKPGVGHERLSGVLFHQKIAQPLRPNLSNLRFSPDGKYILAQDEGGIHVLTVQTLTYLFFIDADNAETAFFSPDSSSVIFYTRALRVERWSIAKQKRESVREMVLRGSCLQTELSPDGNTLACLGSDANLSLYDTATGSTVVERKALFELTIQALLNLDWAVARARANDLEVQVKFANLGFSPDGRYFLAGSRTSSFAYDLIQKNELSLSHGVSDAIRNGTFVFLGPDRIAAVNFESPLKSPLVRFPSGERIAELRFGSGSHLRAPTSGEFLMVGPVKDFGLAVMDPKTQVVAARVKQQTADVYNGLLVYEQGTGMLFLADLATKKSVASIELRDSRLGSSSSITVSDDFKWLAVSTRTRGAVWDLSRNSQLQLVQGFQSGWFAEEGSFYADFPKSGDQERMIGRLDPGGGGAAVDSIGPLPAKQIGPFLAVRLGQAQGAKEWTFEVRDYVNKTTAWSHKFPKGFPGISWNPAMDRILLEWTLETSAAKEEIKKFPDLKKQSEDTDYFFEVLDLHKDGVVGKILIKTNKSSFRIDSATFDGDWLAVSTKDRQVLVYALATGQENGHVFGYAPSVSSAGNALVVSPSETILDVYDLDTTELRNRLKFAAAVVYRKVSADGKRLFALTSDQTAYILDLAVTASPAATSVASTASN